MAAKDYESYLNEYIFYCVIFMNKCYYCKYALGMCCPYYSSNFICSNKQYTMRAYTWNMSNDKNM